MDSIKLKLLILGSTNKKFSIKNLLKIYYRCNVGYVLLRAYSRNTLGMYGSLQKFQMISKTYEES
jgi:hypothetical protein